MGQTLAEPQTMIIWVIEKRQDKGPWKPCCAAVDAYVHKPDAVAGMKNWRRHDPSRAEYRIRAYRPRS